MPFAHDDRTRFQDADRWPPLLLALRRAVRPDRARVAAYLSLTRSPAGWAAYTEFLAIHRGWIAALARMLAEAGYDVRGPLPDGADAFDAAEPAGTASALPPPRSNAEALGYAYVFEAFRLGCAVLARRIRGLAELPGGSPPPDASGQAGPPPALIRALAHVTLEEHAAVLQAAQEAFSAWERGLAGTLARLGLGPLSAGAHAA